VGCCLFAAAAAAAAVVVSSCWCFFLFFAGVVSFAYSKYIDSYNGAPEVDELFSSCSMKMKNSMTIIAFVWFCLAGGNSQGESLPKPKRNGSFCQFLLVIYILSWRV
jgi:hypothetical protein